MTALLTVDGQTPQEGFGHDFRWFAVAKIRVPGCVDYHAVVRREMGPKPPKVAQQQGTLCV